MIEPSPANEAAELAAREAIRDCLYRSALANDLCDGKLWKSTYWPDAREDHGYFKGNAHAFVDATLPSISRTMDATWHNLGNIIIRLASPALAISIAYASVYCRMVADDGRRWDLLAGVRYLDRLQRRGSEWRILDRVTKTDWMREATDSLDWGRADPASGAPMPLGSRHKDDPVFTLFPGGDLTALHTGLATGKPGVP
jgi:hypothetical protein